MDENFLDAGFGEIEGEKGGNGKSMAFGVGKENIELVLGAKARWFWETQVEMVGYRSDAKI